MKRIISAALFLFFALASFSQLSWLQMPDFPGTGKNALVAFSIGNKGYMGLGEDANGVKSTDWYEYNPVNNTWTAKASFPGAGRSNCASFVIDTKGYVATGQGPNGWTNGKELWQYDAINNTWTQKATFPGSSRMNATGFSANGKGYVGTGFIGGAVSSDFYEYDPVGNSWTQKADVPGPTRNGAMGFNIGNKGYIGMGCARNATAYYTDFYEYNPANNTWTQKADFTLPAINNANTYSAPTAGYILCGAFYQYSGITQNPLNMLYKYSPSANAWTLEGTFPGYPRGYAAGFALNNDIYIGGGGRANVPANGPVYSDFWKLADGLTLMIAPGPENTELKLFPNPANQLIFIDGDMAKQITGLRLYDIGGKLLSNRPVKEHEGIDISTLPAGMYFVEAVTADGKIMNSRFVKE